MINENEPLAREEEDEEEQCARLDPPRRRKRKAKEDELISHMCSQVWSSGSHLLYKTFACWLGNGSFGSVVLVPLIPSAP